jgi:hypothetical protein
LRVEGGYSTQFLRPSGMAELNLVEKGLVDVPEDAGRRFGPTATTVNLTENSIR